MIFCKSFYSGAANNCVEVASWRKSSYSKASGECVEVDSGAYVRDSKRPDLGHLAFVSAEWQTFISSVKAAAPVA